MGARLLVALTSPSLWEQNCVPCMLPQALEKAPKAVVLTSIQ